ncbi:MAG: hypothetical protein M3R24_15635 [Chloroflexota bacterium]|nr:hypothetical protein [Chloroflexota bacterium]
MRTPVILPTAAFDLEEVSEIYDYESYVLVNFHVFHDPVHLVLTGNNAAALRDAGLVWYDLLADIKWHLESTHLFSLITVQVTNEDALVVVQCSVHSVSTSPTVVAHRLWNIWDELPLKTHNGTCERTLYVHPTHVHFAFETSLRYAATARGRIEVTGFVGA